ncbi:MAG: aspartate kinase [Candidatus Eisenbacteria bacterium]|uniref:Aspartokinase n=1 Tax=Eiseniibacteriota bacterium TaxID=2212470 RepID=A0A937XCD4_UNCEI|nr:aspartate kinase [Candidatus Eisenbacteria bacterium]
MAIRVVKFGGTSLATPEGREAAAGAVAERAAAGLRLVAVVSAMGRAGEPYATDTLLRLLDAHPQCPPRERDALASCGEAISAALFAALLQARGLAAVSLRGFQAGIRTDDRHQQARILEIRPARIVEALDRGQVAVVAGFQGISPAGDITTIGRGGSDTTAVALGIALGADRVEIFTDVPGVLSADPQVVPGALPVPTLTFEEGAELAFKGAGVLHPRAAELARRARLPVEVLSASAGSSGTRLVADQGVPIERDCGSCAAAVTAHRDIVQVSVADERLARDLGLVESLFAGIAARGVTLDMMSIFPERVAFTLERRALAEARATLDDSGLAYSARERCARVTLVGGGIHGVPGIMHRVVRALAGEGIRVLQSVDSNMIIGVLVEDGEAERAVRALHREFFSA